MSENDKKHDSQSCCCCQSWKAIFIAIAFLTIGAVFGHMMTMKNHYGHMRGLCGGGYGKEAWRDRGVREYGGGFENKFHDAKEVQGKCKEKGWLGHKAEMGKCKPGCPCPMCSKKAAGVSEPDKAGCPMMDKKEGKSEKD